jgi:hypothetical protein
MKPNRLWRPEFERLFAFTFLLIVLIVLIALVAKLIDFLSN